MILLFALAYRIRLITFSWALTWWDSFEERCTRAIVARLPREFLSSAQAAFGLIWIQRDSYLILVWIQGEEERKRLGPVGWPGAPPPALRLVPRGSGCGRGIKMKGSVFQVRLDVTAYHLVLLLRLPNSLQDPLSLRSLWARFQYLLGYWSWKLVWPMRQQTDSSSPGR